MLWSQLNNKLYFVVISYFFNNLNIVLMNSNSFIRVQKKIFFRVQVRVRQNDRVLSSSQPWFGPYTSSKKNIISTQNSMHCEVCVHVNSVTTKPFRVGIVSLHENFHVSSVNTKEQLSFACSVLYLHG